MNATEFIEDFWRNRYQALVSDDSAIAAIAQEDILHLLAIIEELEMKLRKKAEAELEHQKIAEAFDSDC